MLLPRASELVGGVEDVAVVVAGVGGAPLPVQLSPPAMKMLPLCGRMTCELQKMSVPVMFGSVMWPPPMGRRVGSQMS